MECQSGQGHKTLQPVKKRKKIQIIKESEMDSFEGRLLNQNELLIVQDRLELIRTGDSINYVGGLALPSDYDYVIMLIEGKTTLIPLKKESNGKEEEDADNRGDV